MTLKDDIKRAENDAKKGWDADKKLWFPHDSVEGGTQTIAYGHKCTAAEQREWSEKGLSEDAANALLDADLATARAGVAALLASKKVEATLSEGAMAALTEMVFNIGQPSLSGFVEMWKALAAKPPNYGKAADELKDSKWYRDVKAKRGDRVINTMRG